MQDVYKNIEEYNPNKKHTKLIVFDDMIADMLSNKKLNPIATELKNSCFFFTQFHLLCQKILDQILHNILLGKF